MKRLPPPRATGRRPRNSLSAPGPMRSTATECRWINSPRGNKGKTTHAPGADPLPHRRRFVGPGLRHTAPPSRRDADERGNISQEEELRLSLRKVGVDGRTEGASGSKTQRRGVDCKQRKETSAAYPGSVVRGRHTPGHHVPRNLTQLQVVRCRGRELWYITHVVTEATAPPLDYKGTPRRVKYIDAKAVSMAPTGQQVYTAVEIETCRPELAGLGCGLMMPY
ncbi:unnamed protein product [Pleuronectes platessa]|uniref:Uncharacterized protein n=1 Tax=Pleuronectes platessa TaxID=8262 RepID=A0A9N7YUC7_PLEPL|nr:unnamed protein product [Pleuronectes platessa]